MDPLNHYYEIRLNLPGCSAVVEATTSLQSAGRVEGGREKKKREAQLLQLADLPCLA